MNATEWNNLSSGLLGAVIGSIAGFLGSVFLNWRSERKTYKAAGRALLVEMRGNLNFLWEVTSELHVRMPHTEDKSSYDAGEDWKYGDGIWRGQLPLIAQLLDMKGLEKVANAYRLSSTVLFKLKRARNAHNYNFELGRIMGQDINQQALPALREAVEILQAKVGFAASAVGDERLT